MRSPSWWLSDSPESRSLGPEPPVPRPVLLYRSKLSRILKARQADFSFHNPRQFLGGQVLAHKRQLSKRKCAILSRVEQSSHGSTGTPSRSCLLTPVMEASSVSRSLRGAVNPAVTRRPAGSSGTGSGNRGKAVATVPGVPCCCRADSELAQMSLGRQDLDLALGGEGRGRWEEFCVCDSGLLSGKGRDPSGSAGSLALQSDVRVSAPAWEPRACTRAPGLSRS